jgi:hypothetical protein
MVVVATRLSLAKASYATSSFHWNVSFFNKAVKRLLIAKSVFVIALKEFKKYF